VMLQPSRLKYPVPAIAFSSNPGWDAPNASKIAARVVSPTLGLAGSQPLRMMLRF
jgi:hypothetical protein